MKKRNYFEFGMVALILITMGCASNGGGNDILGSVDRSLASVEQTAQAGRQIVTSGATGITTGQVGLTDILTRQLGISQQQALGGAGAIFQVAQASMTPQAFSALSQSLPGMNAMLSAAPVMRSPILGLNEHVSSMIGGAGTTLNSAASLAASFQQLNLAPEMVGQFIPIMTDYVRNTSGQVTVDLLRSALIVR